jgi:hypothetical protein
MPGRVGMSVTLVVTCAVAWDAHAIRALVMISFSLRIIGFGALGFDMSAERWNYGVAALEEVISRLLVALLF